MHRHVKRGLLMVAGWSVLLVGVAGLVLPLLPGWALIFVGLSILAVEEAWAKGLLDRIKARLRRGEQGQR